MGRYRADRYNARARQNKRGDTPGTSAAGHGPPPPPNAAVANVVVNSALLPPYECGRIV